MFFAKKCEHTVPMFINANLMSLRFLYYITLFELMHDVRYASAPLNIRNLFTNTSTIHSYNTRSSTSNNFYIKPSRLEVQKNAFSRFSAKLCNEIPCSLREQPKNVFKKRIQSILLNVLKEEDSFPDVHKIISTVKSSVDKSL